MPGMGFFEIFAECAIAFTGFGAVHAALQGSDGPRGVFRAWTVMSHGALAFVLSILPLLFALTSLRPEQIWWWASIVAVLGTSAMACTNIIFDVRMTRLGYPPQASIVLRSAQSASVISILPMLLNIVGWPKTGPLLYAVGVVLVLVPGLLALLHSFLMPIQISLHRD